MYYANIKIEKKYLFYDLLRQKIKHNNLTICICKYYNMSMAYHNIFFELLYYILINHFRKTNNSFYKMSQTNSNINLDQLIDSNSAAGQSLYDEPVIVLIRNKHV